MSDIPLFEIPWDEADLSNVVESITRGGYWAKGPYVDEFESKLADYFDVEHALVVNSGTTALECILRAHGIGEGDEVLVPSFTFIATANVVELVGAEPVFVDIERETFGMDPEDARRKITDDTAMLLPIHCYGSPCLIEDLVSVAEDAEVPIIEDTAEAFGAIADGQKAGTFGDAAALSFCQNKILPTGEGGAILTESDSIAEAVKSFRSHGRQIEGDYFDSTDTGRYTSVGSNYRMSDLVAALGCSQFDKVESLIEGRRKTAAQYRDAFRDADDIQPVTGRDGESDRNVYQLYTIQLENEAVRSTVIEELAERDIHSKIYWDPPVHETAYYEDYEVQNLETTEEISRRVLSLPMYPTISEDDVSTVADAVISALHEV